MRDSNVLRPIQPSSRPPEFLRWDGAVRSFVLLTVLSVSLLLSGCGSPENNPRQHNNTFYFNIGDPMQTLDPVQITGQANWWVGEMIHAGLIGLDSKMNPIPKIARSWEISDDGLTWTFHLRDDARFADDPSLPNGKGRAVTAQDVLYSFERLCQPGVSRGFWVFRGKVQGADAYYNSRVESTGTPVESVSGLRVINNTTLQITLVEPFPPFIYMLTTPFCYVVPHEAVDKYGVDFAITPVGAGPFRLTEWKPNQWLTLQKNDNYFEKDERGASLPYLDSVWITFIGDASTVFTDFTQGNLDLLTTIEPVHAEILLDDGGNRLTSDYAEYSLHAAPGMSVDYFGFTLDTTLPGGKDSPFARNRYLRQAINYGIDRERITRYVLKGLAVPAHNGPIPPSTPGFTNVQGYVYDQKRALALLDSAGYPNGEGLPPFTLQLGTNQKTLDVAEAVQEDMEKLGLQMEVKPVDFATHLNTADEGKIPFWRTSWLADYPHAENFMANFYSPYHKPSGPNRSRYINPAVDSLYRAALKPGLSQAEWSTLYGQAERTVLDDAPWVFIYYNGIRQLTQSWISGYQVDPLQRINLLHVKKTHTTEKNISQ